jgi:hypothetical protein
MRVETGTQEMLHPGGDPCDSEDVPPHEEEDGYDPRIRLWEPFRGREVSQSCLRRSWQIGATVTAKRGIACNPSAPGPGSDPGTRGRGRRRSPTHTEARRVLSRSKQRFRL